MPLLVIYIIIKKSVNFNNGVNHVKDLGMKYLKFVVKKIYGFVDTNIKCYMFTSVIKGRMSSRVRMFTCVYEQ